MSLSYRRGYKREKMPVSVGIITVSKFLCIKLFKPVFRSLFLLVEVLFYFPFGKAGICLTEPIILSLLYLQLASVAMLNK